MTDNSDMVERIKVERVAVALYEANPKVGPEEEVSWLYLSPYEQTEYIAMAETAITALATAPAAPAVDAERLKEIRSVAYE